MRWWSAILVGAGCTGGEGKDGGDPTGPTTPTDTVDTTDSVDPTDTTPGSVEETVRIVTSGEEVALVGVDLLVSDADGGIVETATTDGDGEVHVDVPPGGSITYGEPYFDGFRLSTVWDIEDGGVVVLASYRFFASTTTTGGGAVYDIDVNVVSSPATVIRYEFYTRCDGGNANSPGPWTFDNAGCPGYPTDQVLVVGFDQDDAIVAWSAAFDLPLPIDESVTLSQTAVAAQTLTLTGIPADATALYRSLSPARDGWRTAYDTAYLMAGIQDEEITTLEVPDLAYDTVTVGASVELGSGGLSWHVKTAGPPAPAASFDFSGPARVSVDPLDLADPLRPEISWVATAGDRGDVGTAYQLWTTAPAYVYWDGRFDPGARTSVRIPELPPEWTDFAEAPVWMGAPYVGFEDADWRGGYADSLDQVARPAEEEVWSTSALGDEPGYL